MKQVLRSFSMALLITSIAVATTVIPMSVERLTRASTHVLVGSAEKSWTQWNPEHTLIFTYTQFRVTRSLKGSTPSTVVIKQMGGSNGAYEQKVAGVRQFRAGDQAVVFVHPSRAADGTLVITGLMQGNFRVMASDSQQAEVSNGVPDADRLDPETGSVEHFAGARMPMARLEALVQAAARAEGIQK